MESKFVLALDASQVHEYLTCPLKWYYRYKENLELNEYSSKRAAPDQGTLVHLLLDKYYNARQESLSIELATSRTIEEFIRDEETLNLFPMDKPTNEIRDFLTKRFHLYTQRYSQNDFEVAKDGIELGFSKLLYEDELVKFIVEGRIDLINYIKNGYDKLLCFTDHKTQGRAVDLYKYKIQFKTYAWATGYNYGMINYFGMQKNYEEGKTFRRDLIYFPPEMIHEWEQKLKNVFWDIYLLLYKKASTTPELAFYNNRNEASCGGAFDSSPCQYTNICEEYNWDMKQKVKEFKYTKKEPWSPWKIKQ